MDVPSELLVRARRRENESERILDALAVAVLALDVSGAIRFANPAAESLFGRSLGYLKGRPLDEFCNADSAFLEFVTAARQHRSGAAGRVLRLSGPGLSNQDMTVSLGYDTEHDELVIGLLPAARRAQHDTSGGEAAGLAGLARMLAHEVNNPLAGLIGASQLLMRQAREDQKELLQLVHDEADRIRRLVRRFAEFETFSTPSLRPVNIHEVLHGIEALSLSSFSERICLHTHYDPSLPEIEADPDHLHKAFFNLVKNAVEANENRGEPAQVRLATAYRSGVRALAGRPTRGALEVSVEDDGPGIPSALRGRLFDAFVTTKPNGFGVGLSVVSDIVSAHGGSVDLDSRPGQTRFVILLPIGDSKA